VSPRFLPRFLASLGPREGGRYPARMLKAPSIAWTSHRSLRIEAKGSITLDLLTSWPQSPVRARMPRLSLWMDSPPVPRDPSMQDGASSTRYL